MKMIFAFALILLSAASASAQDSGLSCAMAYSSASALATHTDSNAGWLVAGQRMSGSAVGVDRQGLWTNKPAHSILVIKSGTDWTVTIYNDKQRPIGTFSFPDKEGLKATLATKAFRANESEDPPQYDKLEVSCSYTIFAG